MSRDEQETTIVFTAADDTATVYTCDPVWKRRMERAAAKCAEIVQTRTDGEGVTYSVPKRCVRVTPPRIVSPEQRQAAAERLRKAREARQ